MQIHRTQHRIRMAAAGLLAATIGAVGASCGSNDSGGGNNGGGPPTQTGQSCTKPSECYPNVADGGVLKGTVTCLQVPGGYCTHTCKIDADCCAVPGECSPSHPQVCSPFESTGQTYCFLSCEDSVVGTTDSTTYCHDYASSAFGCRSTGGGSANRKVCVP